MVGEDDEWIEFTRRAMPRGRPPYVSLQVRGNISLNQASYDLLHAPSHVVLLYQPKHRIIGVRPADPSVPHSYPVRRQQNSASYIINAGAFTSHNEIPTGTTRRYPGVVKDGILIIDLKEEPLAEEGPRGPRKRKAHADETQ